MKLFELQKRLFSSVFTPFPLRNRAIDIEKQAANAVQPLLAGRRGAELKKEWAKIPSDVDVLMTHTPPFEIMDESPYGNKPIGMPNMASGAIYVVI